MLYVCSSFSLNMLPDGFCGGLTVRPLTVEEASSLLQEEEFVSAVGHEDTARVFGATLGRENLFNRVDVKLRDNDTALVGQYSGPRLVAGAQELPPGAQIKWFTVRPSSGGWVLTQDQLRQGGYNC